MNKEKTFTTYFFDFDGTICNTSEGIFASMEKVCEHYGLSYGKETFVKMIGPSLKESFSTIFNLPESEIQNAIDVYRAFYSKEGMYMCSVYDGVAETIAELKNRGKKIFVATSKPEVYTKQIIEQKKLSDLFDFIGGADIAERTRTEKIDVINYIFAENNITDKSGILMVGDRKYDILGAKKAGLKSCGILWGFGSQKEFTEAGADYIIEKPGELLSL